ncbi:MAG: STAS domain-containing protein [Lachnospiraceae bacterium]|nr:STAS domain-containing protein [Lachnospiraceae bacterium]
MYIEEISSEGSLQLNVEGKIDSVSSKDFQDTVLKSFQKSSNIIVNMEGVPYISSAALRALTLGQKTAESRGGRMTVINVQPAVMDVFRTTGFDKLLTIG